MTKTNMISGIGKSYKHIKVATYFVDTNFLTLLLSFSPGGIY
ncbi:AbrB family transcriptional regulator [Candidatus Pelagibacter sp.]|nr:AbrB family transcriptional regulator [Candidatus Pelagibacter sp.]